MIKIWMLKKEFRDGLAFEAIDWWKRQGVKPKKEMYECVYETNDMDSMSLDEIYEKLNCNHPIDYNVRSLSISDVVENAIGQCYFCDSCCWLYLGKW